MEKKIFIKNCIASILFFIATNISLFSNPFGGGLGTETDPFRIYTKEHIEELADSVNNSPTTPNNWSKGKYFILMNDITDSVRTVIGYNNRAFQGNFDGNNKKIILGLDYYNTNPVALFGLAVKCELKNIIVSGYVIGMVHIGGIAGRSENNVVISNCINLGFIKGHYAVGGILGDVDPFFLYYIENIK